MPMGVLPAYGSLCSMYLPGNHRGQKRASQPLEMELQTDGILHVGAGNQSQVLRKSYKFSNCSDILRLLKWPFPLASLKAE